MLRIIIEIDQQKKGGVLLETSIEECTEEPSKGEKRVATILRGLIGAVMDDFLKRVPGIGKQISKSDADLLKGLDKIDL